MDPISTDDEEANRLKKEISEIVKTTDPTLSLHDFRIVKGDRRTNIIFDLVVPYSEENDEEKIKSVISQKIKELDKTYFAVIEIDNDYVL